MSKIRTTAAQVRLSLCAPDGAVTTLEDEANGNWTYTYDALNRLLTANCSAHCPGGQASLDLGWTYDRLGNRWSQAPTAGAALPTSASFTGQDNRMDGASYDAAGNLLVSGKVGDPDYRTYTWDAEGRLTGVGGDVAASYAYDAEGRRVSTTVAGVTRLRFFDQQGRTVRRTDPSGQWLSSEIYALGQPLATYDQSGAEGMTWFMDVDPVGTVRTITNGSGQFAQACTSLPFGDGQACSPAISDPSPLHFTGQPRDPETGLDDFGARFYASSLGRWMTPDWSAQAEPVPYAKLDNPQSLNLYAYVLNNPVTSVDPDGHWPTDVHDEIIDLAFPGLSDHQRAVLKSASFWMDHCLTCQNASNSYQHFMRAPDQAPAAAKQQAESFIKTKETQAKNDAGGNVSNAKSIGDPSLNNFGKALHTTADGTSPAHVDADGNPRGWPGIPVTGSELKQVQQHEQEEAHPTSQQLQGAVSAARRAFAQTYGPGACQSAAETACAH